MYFWRAANERLRERERGLSLLEMEEEEGGGGRDDIGGKGVDVCVERGSGCVRKPGERIF